MNKLVNRLQTLRQRAGQLKTAVEAAPARAAQLREAVNATAGQLQQLRTDVQGTVAALKSDSEASLAEALVELDGGLGLLARAGYDLTGIDLEQGASPRLIVHLDQIEAARTEPIEQLARECAGKRTLHALLVALIRAEALEEKVRLGDLSFRGLIVHVGPIPTVRLCWRRAEEPPDEPVVTPTSASQPATLSRPAATPPPLPLTAYGTDSFFARTSPIKPTPQNIAGETPQPVGPTPAPASASSRALPDPAAPVTGDWRKDALARFKKMPDLRR